MGRRIRLLILSPHRLFRESLSTVLAEVDRFSAIDHCASIEELQERLDEQEIDVLLLDLSQPIDGIRATIETLADRLRVVIIGAGADAEADIMRCVEAGARGSLDPDAGLDELCVAVERVMNGEAVCPPEIAASMFSRLSELARERERSHRLEALQLTPREMEILAFVAANLRNQAIADRLRLSVHTVKNHVHNILDKLQVSDRGEAVEFAYRKGWLRERRRI